MQARPEAAVTDFSGYVKRLADALIPRKSSRRS